MPPFSIEFVKFKSPRAETLVSQDPGTMNPHTIADVVVMLGKLWLYIAPARLFYGFLIDAYHHP